MPQGAELSHLSGWAPITDHSSYGLAVLALPDGTMTQASFLRTEIPLRTHRMLRVTFVRLLIWKPWIVSSILIQSRHMAHHRIKFRSKNVGDYFVNTDTI